MRLFRVGKANPSVNKRRIELKPLRNIRQRMTQNPAHQAAAFQLLTAMKNTCEESGEYQGMEIYQPILTMPLLYLTLKGGKVVPIETYVNYLDGELCYEYPDIADENLGETICRHCQQAYQKARENGTTLSFRTQPPQTARRATKRFRTAGTGQ